MKRERGDVLRQIVGIPGAVFDERLRRRVIAPLGRVLDVKDVMA